MTITFYHSHQSNADRIRTSLVELGIPHETVAVDLRAGDQRKPEFLALNPNGKVPTIVIDGTPMFESVAIQIALGERYGVERGLWPQLGSPEHLQALTWLIWGQVTLSGAMIQYMQNSSDWIPKERHNAASAEYAMGEFTGLLAILDARLNGRDYVTGGQFTLADLDLASVLGWGMHMTKADISGMPHLQAWLGRIHARPSFAREQPAH